MLEYDSWNHVQVWWIVLENHPGGLHEATVKSLVQWVLAATCATLGKVEGRRRRGRGARRGLATAFLSFSVHAEKEETGMGVR